MIVSGWLAWTMPFYWLSVYLAKDMPLCRLSGWMWLGFGGEGCPTQQFDEQSLLLGVKTWWLSCWISLPGIQLAIWHICHWVWKHITRHSASPGYDISTTGCENTQPGIQLALWYFHPRVWKHTTRHSASPMISPPQGVKIHYQAFS